MSAPLDPRPPGEGPPSSWAIVSQLLTLPNLGLNLFLALAFVLAASGGHVSLLTAALVLLAFFGARNAGHAFNQLVDRRIDAANPRTRARPLPRGAVRPRTVAILVALNVALFFVAAWLLRPLLALLAIPALALVLGYSYTKRYTAGTTVILGAVQALIPAGVYLALFGTIPVVGWIAIAALLLFGTAFECVHSLGDLASDQAQGLRSLPLAAGRSRTPLMIAGLLVGALALLLLYGIDALGPKLPLLIAWAGMGLVAVWEVGGLARGSVPLPRLFRAHFVLGALFLVGVAATLAWPIF